MVSPEEPAARVELYAKDFPLLVYEDDSAPRAGALRAIFHSALESWGTSVGVTIGSQDDGN